MTSRRQFLAAAAAEDVVLLRTAVAGKVAHILDHSEQPVLLDLIRLIEASPQVSQRTVAVSLGVSLGKANYCIRELIKKGLVKAPSA